jgi:membrane associated rhomboid family serine protease
MLQLNCRCGEPTEVPESFIGGAAKCLACGAALRPVATCAAVAATEADSIPARLTVTAGPNHAGTQFFLAGDAPIEIGKLPDKPICLAGGATVSRNHCRLVRSENGGWHVEDQGSTNGIAVNSHKTKAAELRDGDVLRVGEFELTYSELAPRRAKATAAAAVAAAEATAARAAPAEAELEDLLLLEDELGAYDLAEPEAEAEPPPTPRRVIPIVPSVARGTLAAPHVTAATGGATGEAPICPCCDQQLAYNAKVCIACGIKVPSGRPIVTSRGMDEEDLAVRAKAWIQLVSWILLIGLFPIASEAFGTRKARAIWIIFGITMLVSGWFLVVNIGFDPPHYANLMLWVGSPEARQRQIERLVEREYGKDIDEYQTEQQSRRAQRLARPGKSGPPSAATRSAQDRQKAREKMIRELAAAAHVPAGEDFHAYQLLTAALLHGGILHFAGNMVFLLVFGLRVNELIGDAKFAIIYPLLAIASGLAYMLAMHDQPLHPCLGASGAIMGLAGMYLVLFPVQRVHMAFWIGVRVWAWFILFRMRGFWLLVLWLAFNDLLPMALAAGRRSSGDGGAGGGSFDGVAHWAHLGGFLTGVVIALGLLVSRLSSARGGDILSVAFGRHAWPLLGKPSQHLEAPVISNDPPKPRVVLQRWVAR